MYLGLNRENQYCYDVKIYNPKISHKFLFSDLSIIFSIKLRHMFGSFLYDQLCFILLKKSFKTPVYKIFQLY